MVVMILFDQLVKYFVGISLIDYTYLLLLLQQMTFGKTLTLSRIIALRCLLAEKESCREVSGFCPSVIRTRTT